MSAHPPRLQPALVKLGVFEKDVKGGGRGRIQAAAARAEAAAKAIEVEKPPGRMGHHAQRRQRPGFSFLRGARGETVNRGDVIGDILIREVEDGGAQPGHTPGHHYLVVRVYAADVSPFAAKQAYRIVTVERTGEIMAQMVENAADAVAIGRRRRSERGLDLRP